MNVKLQSVYEYCIQLRGGITLSKKTKQNSIETLPEKQNEDGSKCFQYTYFLLCYFRRSHIILVFSSLLLYPELQWSRAAKPLPQKTLISPLFAATGDITQFYLPTKTDALLDLQRVLEGAQKQGGTTPEVQQPL